MGNKKVRYDEGKLRDVLEVLLLHRQQTPQLAEFRVNLEGFAEAIKKLNRGQRKAVEKFFGLETGQKEKSYYQQYCKVVANEEGQKEVFWMKMPPTSLRQMYTLAFTAISELQGTEFLILYDTEFKELCMELEQKVETLNRGVVYDIKMLLLYCYFIRGGPDLFVDEKNNEVTILQEDDCNFDEYSVLQLFANEISNSKKKVKLYLIEEFLELLPEKQVAEMYWALKIPMPKAFLALDMKTVESKSFYSFTDVRRLKKKIFPKGPWLITERAIMGQNVTLKGLRKIYQSHREDWLKNENLYLAQKDLELPKGKVVKQFSFATSVEKVDETNVFSDFGEIMTLKYWDDHGLLG